MKNFRLLIVSCIIVLLCSMGVKPYTKPNTQYGKLAYRYIQFHLDSVKKYICGDESIKSLTFAATYDADFLRDDIILEVYSISNNDETKLLNNDLFKIHNKLATSINKNKKISNFEISRQELCSLIDSFSNIAEYFLLTPEEHPSREGKFRNTIIYRIKYIKKTSIVGMSAKKIFTKKFLRDEIEDTGEFLNPSPPAKPNYLNRDE